MNSDTVKRLGGMLGLCARARKLVIGTELAVESVKKERSSILLIAFDASENTKKKIFNCARYYETACYEIPISTSDLGRYIGKMGNIASVAVIDHNMVKGIKKIINETNEQTSKADNYPWEV